jgi:hypothetical protein
VKRYYKSLKAINKVIMTYLTNLHRERERRDVTEYACISKGEIGFNEIIAYLLKQKSLQGVYIKEVEELHFNRVSPWISSEKRAEIWSLLFEDNPKMEIPQGVEWMSVVTHGIEKHMGIHIGSRAPYDLEKEIKHNLKQELANYILGFVIAWMVINTLFVFYINLWR